MTTQDAIDRDWQKAEEEAEDNLVLCFVCGEVVRQKEYPRDFTGKGWKDHLEEKCISCQEEEESQDPEADYDEDEKSQEPLADPWRDDIGEPSEGEINP